MTTREAAIVSLYTGFLVGEFAEMQKLAEELAGHGVWTHMFADRAFNEQMHEKSKPLFVGIEVR